MGYAILRTQKLKSGHAMRRSLKHAFREQDTPNADPSRADENTHIGAYNVAQALERFNARLPAKVRKNGVLAIEYLVTGSPDDMRAKSRQEQDSYFEDALNWLEKKHGKENVVYVGIHRDETTPHLYAYVVPIDERGKLNCRAYLGGAKALNQMQTDFAEKVGMRHGLQRGIEGSKAKHTSIQQFYARTNAPFVPLPEVETNAPRRREEPAKPGMFASKHDKESWQRDHASWQKEQIEADNQDKKRKAERKARADAALALAVQYQAQAKEAEALKIEISKMKISNSHYVMKSSRLETINRNLLKIAQSFTPEEIESAKNRQQQNEVAEAKAAIIRTETTKRMQGIQTLLQRGGVEYTLGMAVAAALQKANGDAKNVQWLELELHVASEAIGKHGHSPDHVTQVILEHSPGCANPDTHERLQCAIRNIVSGVQIRYSQERDQSNECEQDSNVKLDSLRSEPRGSHGS